jgi:hypothetical protein
VAVAPQAALVLAMSALSDEIMQENFGELSRILP